MTFFRFFVGFVLAIVVSRTLHVPLLYGIGIVGGIWLLSQMPVGARGGVTGAVRGTLGFFWRLLVGVAVFIGLMMLVSRLTGVPFGYVTGGFQVLGSAPWNWPRAHFGLPILLMVSAAFLAAWIAMRAAEGRPQVAGWIFGVSTVIIFIMMWLPRTAEMARPKPAGGSAALLVGETQGWADADQTASEKGILPTVTVTVWRFFFGPPAPKTPDLKKNGVIGSGARRAWRYLFGEPAPKPVMIRHLTPPALPTPPAPAPPPKPRECSTPCSMRVGYDDQIWAVGRPVQIRFHGKEDWVLLPVEGCVFTREEFSPGEAQFVSLEGDDRSVLVQIISPAAK